VLRAAFLAGLSTSPPFSHVYHIKSYAPSHEHCEIKGRLFRNLILLHVSQRFLMFAWSSEWPSFNVGSHTARHPRYD